MHLFKAVIDRNDGSPRGFTGKRIPPRVDELSKILGFAGKPTEIDGGEVETYFQHRAAYERSPRIVTFRVWLRYELLSGRLALVISLGRNIELIE